MSQLARHALASLKRRLKPPLPQLELRLDPDTWSGGMAPPEGFRLDVMQHSDAPILLKLLRDAGFAKFSGDELRSALHLCVPNGCIGVRQEDTGLLASMMMARHMSDETHPVGGRIDWLATAPALRGLGLGLIAASAVTDRLVRIGYQTIWVTTDDHRAGAVRIFLKLGFKPVRGDTAMAARWEHVLRRINWPT
jgi:ribosomal protein S18 acetylase RimI-like enzyme